MPFDAGFSHAHRLPTPTHHFSALSYTASHRNLAIDADSAAHQPFTLNATSSYAGPSTSRLTNLLVDDDPTSSRHVLGYQDAHAQGGGTRAAGHNDPYRFPEMYNDAAYANRKWRKHISLVQGNHEEHGGRWGGEERWNWDEEEIPVPHHLLLHNPQSEDLLPSEMHSSYPFGRPYHRPSSLHPQASMPRHTTRPHLTEAALWNGLLSTNNSHNSDPTPGGGKDENLVEPLEELPVYLQRRMQVSQVSAAPDWPFVKYGPGRSKWDAVLNPTFVEEAKEGLRDSWQELALETLLPTGKEMDPLVSNRHVKLDHWGHKAGPLPLSSKKPKDVQAIFAKTVEGNLMELEDALSQTAEMERRKGTWEAESSLAPANRNPEYQGTQQLKRIMKAANEESTRNLRGIATNPASFFDELQRLDDSSDDELSLAQQRAAVAESRYGRDAPQMVKLAKASARRQLARARELHGEPSYDRSRQAERGPDSVRESVFVRMGQRHLAQTRLEVGAEQQQQQDAQPSLEVPATPVTLA